MAQSTKNGHLEKQNNILSNELKKVEKKKMEAEMNKEISKNSINQLEKELLDTRAFSREDRNILIELNEKKEQMQKDLTRAENVNRKQAEDITIKDGVLENKQKEIKKIEESIRIMNKKIDELEKEKDKHGMLAAQANAKYLHSLEEIKLKDNLISEFQKKNIETEWKLKQQQNLYEAVRSDRNLYSKQLTETQDEISEIKKRLNKLRKENF